MADAPTTSLKKTRQRSPAHPGIDLETALKRARTLYAQERRNAAHVDTILAHWGYKPKSGAGMVVVAALKYFGLLVDEGSGDTRSAKLSDRALQILLDDDEHSPNRLRAIRDAALAPRIHRELWERYQGTLPSDTSLRRHLLIDRRFTESAADDFIPQFRKTVAFANLETAGTVSQDAEDSEPSEQDQTLTPLPIIDAEHEKRSDEASRGEPQQTQRTIQVPYSTTGWALVQAKFPMDEREWEQMLAVLQAMKPGLVKGPEAGEMS